MTEFKKCNNPECKRKVKLSVVYCCAGCDNAHHRGYEIHESGMLGHTQDCNTRNAERGEYTELDPEYYM